MYKGGICLIGCPPTFLNDDLVVHDCRMLEKHFSSLRKSQEMSYRCFQELMEVIFKPFLLHVTFCIPEEVIGSFYDLMCSDVKFCYVW